MHDHQKISPIGGPDGGSSLLGMILTRLGIMVIVVVGVLIAPTGLPDLSTIGTAVSATASASPTREPEVAERSAARDPFERIPAAKVTPAVWISEKSVIPSRESTPETDSTIDQADSDTIQRSARRWSDEDRGDTLFQRMCRRVKNGLERLGGFVLAGGDREPSDHLIPASFMPSRS